MARAHDVLAAIDLAYRIADRNPRLFAEHLRRDRDCGQLARALQRYRRREAAAGSRADRDDVERVDPEWENTEAQRREAEFKPIRLDNIAARRAARQHRSLLERHRIALAELGRLSTVGAGNVAPSRGGGHDSADLASLQRAAQTVDLTRPEQLMRRAVESYEAALDEALGLGAAPALAALSTFEKDRMILVELSDLTPAEIEVDYSPLGSARTVERLRRRVRRDAQRVANLLAAGYARSEIRDRLDLSVDEFAHADEWRRRLDVKAEGEHSREH